MENGLKKSGKKSERVGALSAKGCFYESEELSQIGLKSYKSNVKISKKASIYSPENIEMGHNVRIDDFCILSGQVKIGSYVHIGAHSALYAQYQPIQIGNFVGISSRVSIYSFSDDCIWGLSLTNPTVPDEYKVLTVDQGPVIIKDHAMISAGSVILPETEIQTGAVIGALSLVRGQVEEWAIYRGNPAKAVQKRPSKQILKLEEKLREKYRFDLD